MWGKIIIPMYRLWLNGLYGLYGPRCPPSSKRPINLISLSLSLLGHGAWQIDQPSNGSMWNSYSFQPVGQWMGYSFTDLEAEGCCRSLNALFCTPKGNHGKFVVFANIQTLSPWFWLHMFCKEINSYRNVTYIPNFQYESDCWNSTPPSRHTKQW